MQNIDFFDLTQNDPTGPPRRLGLKACAMKITPEKKKAAEERDARLKAALKANMARRKAQAKKRAEAKKV